MEFTSVGGDDPQELIGVIGASPLPFMMAKPAPQRYMALNSFAWATQVIYLYIYILLEWGYKLIIRLKMHRNLYLKLKFPTHSHDIPSQIPFFFHYIKIPILQYQKGVLRFETCIVFPRDRSSMQSKIYIPHTHINPPCLLEKSHMTLMTITIHNPCAMYVSNLTMATTRDLSAPVYLLSLCAAWRA